MGVVLKRARYFITCSGKNQGGPCMNGMLIRESLAPKYNNVPDAGYEQLSFLNPFILQ
jgi:predicted DNA-binding helix-hairpin-helix protein